MSGGWIKLEKSLKEDPRIADMAFALRNAYVTHQRINADDPYFGQAFFITTVLGCLSRLWFYADTYIRKDDTISPLAIDGIDQIVGVQGFSQVLPEDWLQVIDAKTIKLPGFQTHNGTVAKKKALTAKRVSHHRERVALKSFADELNSNADALPDKTKTRQDQDHVREARDRESSADEKRILECVTNCKAVWPKGGAVSWIQGEHLIRVRIGEGESPELIEAGTSRYGTYCLATGRIPKDPAKWYGDIEKPWLQEWAVPKADPGAAAAEAKRDAAWAEAKSRAKAIGFRDPWPQESAATYMTQVKQAESNGRPAPKIAALSAQLRK